MSNTVITQPLITGGTMLGIGLGGFVDGIVFHQLLQLHNMLSARFPVRDVEVRTLAVNLEINMFWDGLFHVFCWIMAAIGLAMVWNAVRNPHVPLSTRTFVGSLSLGWGLFNLVEGVIDHHLLHVHHVTETSGHLVWDLGFLASGAALLLLGWGLIRADRTLLIAAPRAVWPAS
ncbi:hypothetical protein Pla108_36940 [Botrimarina colliarenosi]|uniref:DUF2243 domain-containing protein n=1 Tax=Botrimarina colliarenosi TaxID=2528001 RepID=A0A5C6A932_9BACT|nr:DUF2243 domain-containing protein [Botrimarina colliarenosi]TWT94843.1 hypothetical protein Pla108_36940 [Botrimarina colliarenosi]